MYDVLTLSLAIDSKKLHRRLTVRQVENIVTRYVKKAGLNPEGEVMMN